MWLPWQQGPRGFLPGDSLTGFSSLLRTKRLSDWCTVQLWLRLEVVAMYFLRISLWTPSRTPWTCRSLNIDATTRAMSFCSSSNLNQGNNDWPCNLSILQCDRYFGMCITANDIPYVLVNDPVDSSHALVTILKNGVPLFSLSLWGSQSRHGNVLNAPALASNMLRSTALPGKCKDAGFPGFPSMLWQRMQQTHVNSGCMLVSPENQTVMWIEVPSRGTIICIQITRSVH